MDYLELNLTRTIPASDPIPDGWVLYRPSSEDQPDTQSIVLQAKSIKQSLWNKVPLIRFMEESMDRELEIGGTSYSINWERIATGDQAEYLEACRYRIAAGILEAIENPDSLISFLGDPENRDIIVSYLGALIPGFELTLLGELEDEDLSRLLSTVSLGGLGLLSSADFAEQIHSQFPSVPVAVFEELTPDERMDVLSLWKSREEEQASIEVAKVPSAFPRKDVDITAGK